MVATGLNAPLAHGAGRLFDVVAVLALGRGASRYEGQLAIALDAAADAAELPPYPFAIDTATSPWQLDWRPLVRSAAEELLAGVGAGIVSARFHRTLSAAGAELVRRAGAVHGRPPVVLAGGVFQNARLAEQIAHGLEDDFAVYLPSRVPPGDGGIALGQAVVASALAGP